MFSVNEVLAVHALGEKGYYPLLYVDLDVGMIKGHRIVDVRCLYDEPLNNHNDYRLNIMRAVSWLEIDERVVICCGAGISRSPAIAVGVLVKHFKMNFYDAMNLVDEKVPTAQIEPCHISALKHIFNVTVP